MNNRIFLHTGLPKCGSSSLQSRLYENRADLRKQGILYPPPDTPTPMPKHQFVVNGLMRSDQTHLGSILAAPNRPNLILSTEGLTNHLYDFSAASLDMFRALVGNDYLTCIIIRRDPAAWVKSYYKQAIINPKVNIPSVHFYGSDITLTTFRSLPRVHALTDHVQLQADVGAAYGAAEVCMLDLKDDWQAQFDNIVQIDSSGFQTPPTRKNESPPDACIEILRQVNSHNLPEAQRLHWKAALHRFSGSTHTLMQHAADSDWQDLSANILKTLRANQCPEMNLDEATLAKFRDFAQAR
jgi:hypothetical protein